MEQLAAPTPVRTAADAVALLRDALTGLAHEELRVLHLDARLRPLGTTVALGGATVEAPLRTIVGDALRLGSRAMLIAHNHPGGDPIPSRSDRETTRRLAEAARMLDIRLIDHIVFGDDAQVSFRALGLL